MWQFYQEKQPNGIEAVDFSWIRTRTVGVEGDHLTSTAEQGVYLHLTAFISGRRHGKVLGHAHVHNVRAAEDRHEGRWPSAGPWSASQKGEKFRPYFTLFTKVYSRYKLKININY